MSIKRGSILHEKLVNKMEFNIPKQEELNKMYEETEALAKDLGMKPYYMYRQKYVGKHGKRRIFKRK